MYILLGEKQDKKITVIEKTVDQTMLTLYINREFSMDEIYDAFTNNKLDIIKIYNDDGSLYGIYTNYIKIDSFFFNSITNSYVLNLIRQQNQTFERELNECKKKIEELSNTVSVMQTYIISTPKE